MEIKYIEYGLLMLTETFVLKNVSENSWRNCEQNANRCRYSDCYRNTTPYISYIEMAVGWGIRNANNKTKNTKKNFVFRPKSK